MPSHPDMNGINWPGLLGLVLVLLAVFGPMLFGRRGRGSDESGPDADGGGGNGGPGPPGPPNDAPRGGIPIDHAEPARVRLRDHVRLADRLPRRERRPTPEPERSPRRVGPRGA